VVPVGIAWAVVEVKPFVLGAGATLRCVGSPLLLLVRLRRLVGGAWRRVHHLVLQWGTAG
jgi:hypothetical protein